jgi:hypothetical protein
MACLGISYLKMLTMKNIIIKFFFLFELIIAIQTSYSQTITPQWALQIGGTGDDRGIKVVSDISGNIYFASVFEKQADIVSNGSIDSLESKGKQDVIFGKLDSAGIVLWSKHIGGKGADAPTDIITTPDGFVYLSGIFEDTLFIGLDTIVSLDYIDSFIAKYDSVGNLSWIRQISGVGNQQCVSLICDLNGNLLTAGYFTKTLEFPQTNSENFISQGGYDGFFAKWTPQGDLILVDLIQGTGKTMITDCLIDYFNDYYFIGDFTDSLTINGSQSLINSLGYSDVFIVKYDNNGTISWIRSLGSIYDDKAKCLTLGGNGKMIMTGEFKEDLIYSNDILMSARGGDDIFHLTFNKNGNLQHHKKHGHKKNDYVFDAWIPVGQKIVMASDLRINEGNKNTTLASYGLLGDMCDVYQTGEDLNPTVLSALMTDEGHIYYCGNFHGTVTFDQITLNSQGTEDMFLMKMAPEEVMLNLTKPDTTTAESEQIISLQNRLSANSIISQTNTETESVSNAFFNYPNPFFGGTQIIYSLSEECSVDVKIIDANGREIKEWSYLSQSTGEHILYFNSEVLDGGIYTCKLVAQGKSVFISKSIKMVCGN